MAQAIGQGSRVAQGEDPSLIKLRNRSEKEKAVDENVIQGNVAKKRKFEEAGTVIPERMIQRVEEGNETGYGDSTMCISSRGGRIEENSSGGQIRAGHRVVAAGHVGGFQTPFTSKQFPLTSPPWRQPWHRLAYCLATSTRGSWR